MKFAAKSLLVAVCFSLAVIAAAAPLAAASTRSSTAFGSFHVQSATALTDVGSQERHTPRTQPGPQGRDSSGYSKKNV